MRRKILKTVVLVFLACGTSNSTLYSQSDTSFWFSAPEVCLGNFTPYLDRPIRLVLSTYSSAATVNISQPANPGFTPINVNILANSFQTVDLSPWLSMIECKPANAVLNYGFHITSTSIITAYYEVVSPGNNPEIFTLKGKNAEGLDFYVPTQNLFDNNGPGYPVESPRNSFDITATENGTIVTITPSQNIVGHVAGIPFVINLNKGQVYSATASTYLAAGHLAGSRVISNKPIVITQKDDLIRPLGLPCSDLMGDQIVPIDKLGTEHVVVRGYLNYPPTINNEDFFFVLATQNGTSISVNGSYVTTINAGNTYNSVFTGVSVYIQTDKPVAVIHVSGTGCEMAQAMVPPIPCSGSSEVSFTRTSAQNFGLILLAPSGSEGNFTINTPLSITPANFSPVPGTGGQWMATIINCNTTEIPVSQNIRVTNSTDLFHLGIINYGSAPGGCRYGYFSDYNSIELVQEDSLALCPGDSLLISASTIMDSYNWNTGDTTSSILVDTAGIYVLSSIKNFCTIVDTIIVTLDAPFLDLGTDTQTCLNNNIVLSASGFNSYVWSTGATSSSITVLDSGLYFLNATGLSGCSALDSIYISYFPHTVLELGNDTSFCNSAIPLSIGANNFASYLWSTNDTIPFIDVNSTGSYSLTVVDSFFCEQHDTIDILFNVAFVDLGPDTILCYGDQTILSAPSGYSEYGWNTGDTTMTITTVNDGSYSVQVEMNGCFDQDTILVQWFPDVSVALGNDTSICSGEQITLSIPGFETYSWSSTPIDTSQIFINTAGQYILTVGNNGCFDSDTMNVFVSTLNVDLGPDLIICQNDSVGIGVSGFDSYLWNTSDTTSSIWITSSGTFSLLVTDINGCSAADTVGITQSPPIVVDLGNDTTICEGDSITLITPLSFITYLWSDGSSGNTLVISQAGTYSVIVTDINNCTASDSLNLILNPLPVTSLPAFVTCLTDSIVLDAGIGADSYLWSNGSTLQTIHVTQTGVYSVTITLDGCFAFDSTFVTLISPANLSLNDTTICEGNGLHISVLSGFDSYLWNTGATSPFIDVNQPGTYWVSVESCGSIWQDTMQVIMLASINNAIVPNVFTPNGDGLNDVYSIVNLTEPPSVFELLIYDRWGLLVYSSDNYLDGWNGTIGSANVTEGVYYYILNMESTCGEAVQKNGFLTLFR